MDEINKLKELAGIPLKESTIPVKSQIVGDLSNGYHSYKKYNADGLFPEGATGTIQDSAGPSSAKQGDNPLQKKAAVTENLRESIHRDLVHAYRKHKSE